MDNNTVVLICVVVVFFISIYIFVISIKRGKIKRTTNDKIENCSPPVVALRNCSKKFNTPAGDLQVLKSVNLDIRRGDIIAILGKSGCGKSTLLNIIAGLDTPDYGTKVYFGGKLINFSDKRELICLRKQVGFIYQGHNLIPHLSALDNVAIALVAKGCSWRIARAQAEIWMEKVGLQERLYYQPHQLSGGQQQRVGLARALVASPKILLADEPTGNLDIGSAKKAMNLLRICAVKSDVPVLIATHDKNLAMDFCDRIFQWNELDGVFCEVHIPKTVQIA